LELAEIFVAAAAGIRDLAFLLGGFEGFVPVGLPVILGLGRSDG
jgi:hypothetical protein